MKVVKVLFPLLGVVLAAGCSTVSVEADKSGVKEAVESDVANCQFLRSVSATSMFTGLWQGKALEDLRHKIFTEAHKIGATHVVLGRANSNEGGTFQDARAYRCP